MRDTNFVKAFKHFSLHEADEAEDIEYQLFDDVSAENDSQDANDQVLYRLPPHRRCSCHLLNLVATTDAAKIESGIMKRTYVQTFAKLSALWNKQNRSTSAAEKIKDANGNLLPTPGYTRWNSVYDAVAKVNDLLLTPAQQCYIFKTSFCSSSMVLSLMLSINNSKSFYCED